MWKSTVEPGRPQMTIWRIRIAGWIPEATNTSAEYVMRIVSLLQQWLHVRGSKLRQTYIACLARFQTDSDKHLKSVFCFLLAMARLNLV